jgi:hypothetical protein
MSLLDLLLVSCTQSSGVRFEIWKLAGSKARMVELVCGTHQTWFDVNHSHQRVCLAVGRSTQLSVILCSHQTPFSFMYCTP